MFLLFEPLLGGELAGYDFLSNTLFKGIRLLIDILREVFLRIPHIRHLPIFILLQLLRLQANPSRSERRS